MNEKEPASTIGEALSEAVDKMRREQARLGRLVDLMCGNAPATDSAADAGARYDQNAPNAATTARLPLFDMVEMGTSHILDIADRLAVLRKRVEARTGLVES